MDITRFCPNPPGKLVPLVTEWGPDHAFVPNDLPPFWEFPEHLWPLLSDAKQQVGILEGLGRTIPNPAILLRPLEDREAIQSSRLEGTYASPKELLLFELSPREPKSGTDPTNDHREVYNYRLALLHATQSPLPISLRLIRDVHGILMKGVRGRDKSPGEFRKIPVGIGSGGRFIPPPPDCLSDVLGKMETYCHAPSAYDNLVNCFLVHYQFETIHPFIDGNGRVGRLLLALMLQKQCELTKPWLYLSEYFEAYRDEYVQRLFDVSAKGDWSGWVEFCLRGTLRQAKETIARCEQLLKIRDEFMAKLSGAGGSLRLKDIVDGIFHSPFVRVKDLPSSLGCTYPTAQADVDKLVGLDILRALTGVKPKTYYSPAVFNVAYEKLSGSKSEP